MTETPKAPRLPAQPRGDPAAAEQSPRFRRIDISAVPNWTRSVTEPRFTVPFRGYVGKSTVRGAKEIKSAAIARKLPSPTPAALEILEDDLNPNILYGIPVMEKSPADLALEWVEQTRQVRANFQAILQVKKLVIPARTKMIIEVTHVEHEELGHCVKLSWTDDCFAPIQVMDELDDEEESQS